MEQKGKSAEVRFFEKVKKTESCWIWIGTKSKGLGSYYGEFWINGSHIKGIGKKVYAHRFSFFLKYGHFPEKGKHTDHLCRNTLCVNPDHLEEVSPRINILRGVGISSKNSKKIHCPYGHSLDGKNILGTRYCKTCHREREKRRRIYCPRGHKLPPPDLKLRRHCLICRY